MVFDAAKEQASAAAAWTIRLAARSLAKMARR
jgi:hypothetical protein